jgi:hypothetical protein
VKRVNGLTTDLQMFAHKTLRIPLPGRHPPAPTTPSSSPSHADRTRLVWFIPYPYPYPFPFPFLFIVTAFQ